MDFRYPILSEEELLEFINANFLVNYSFEAFIKPTQELMVNIYDKFLFDFGIDHRVPQLKAIPPGTNMAMNAKSFALINIVAAVSKLLEKTRLTDFSMSDLIRPQRKRNQIILSQLVGLFERFHDLLDKWEVIAAEREMKKRKTNETRKRIEEKKKLLEKQLIVLAELTEKYPDPEAILDQTAREYSAAKERSSELKAKSDELKKAVQQKKEEYAELKLELAQLHEKIAERESQIVRSPEKVFAETKRKEKIRDAHRLERQKVAKQLEEAIAKNADMRKKLEGAQKIGESIQDLKKKVETVVSQCEVVMEAEERSKKRAAKIAQYDISIAKTTEIVEDKKKQKLAAMKAHKERMATKRAMVEEIEKELANLAIEKAAVAEKFEKIEDEQREKKAGKRAEFEEKMKRLDRIDADEKAVFAQGWAKVEPKLMKIFADHGVPV